MEIYGRERELARLDSFLESLHSGSAALLLEGEPGIGKTTVWRAGVDAAARRGYRVLSSRPAEADASLAYAGLADILGEVDGAAFDALPEPQRDALDVALLRRSAAEPSPDPRAVFAALRTILGLLAEDAPTLVAVDDLQWLDGPSARALAFTGRRLDGTRVGLLTSARVDSGRSALTWLERSELFRLEPLTAAALHELVKRRLDWSMPRPTLLRLHSACGGNAFFALELARVLDDAGRPDPRDAWPISDDLRLLVDRRLRALPEAVRDSLLRAAAVSQPRTDLFDPAALRTAEQVGIVTVEAGDRIRFSHPLYASAIYAAAPSAARLELHAQLAVDEDDHEERARHLALATGEPDERVAAELDRAAAGARNRGAPDIAAELEERALELTPPVHRAAAHGRALAAAGLHLHAGALDRVDALLSSLLADADEPAVRAPALRMLAFIRFRQESLDEAGRLLHTAAEVAGDDSELRAPIELDLTFGAFSVSLDHEIGRPHAEAALEHAERTSNRALLSHALAGRAIAGFLLGEGVDEARLARALELESLDDEAALEVRPTLVAGFLAFYTGDFDRARAYLYPLRTRLLERGEDTDLTLLSITLAWLECSAGDMPAARALADEGLQAAALGGAMPAHALALSSLLDAYEGAEAQCRARVEAALTRMGDAEFCLVIQWTSAALGLLELSLGNTAAAHNALRALADFFADRECVEPSHLLSLPDEIEAVVELGELERAERLTDLLAGSGRAFDRPWALATSERCRALLLAAHGDLVGAHSAVERAIDAHGRMSMPLELARTLIVKGQVERRAKRRAAARESLEHALDVCERIGARLWAERARDELGRLGRRREPDDLTATEERVAELAASGLTNREVAAAAFVSQKTVEANLSRIYRKLGIRSRAELGLRLAERERARAPVA